MTVVQRRIYKVYFSVSNDFGNVWDGWNVLMGSERPTSILCICLQPLAAITSLRECSSILFLRGWGKGRPANMMQGKSQDGNREQLVDNQFAGALQFLTSCVTWSS